jgi:quercetin dioxygenase-like cupin family protein
MINTTVYTDVAYIVDPEKVTTLDVLGPTVQLLTPPAADDDSPCVMRGTIPPGVVIPLHSHADPETFFVLSGEVEGLTVSDAEVAWVRIRPGDIFHVPGGARHAFRNQTPAQEPAVMLLISTARIGRFFQEVGKPARPGAHPPDPPSADELRHFQETSDRYGYWNATAEENARIGISLPPA